MGAAAEALPTTNLVLGAYRPLRPLGSGGSGSVWLAVHEPTGREVALKIVAREGRAGERAEREARAAAHLRHPHVLRAYAMGRDPGHVYIAYEYIAGGTLRDAIRNGQLRDGEAIEAAAQILDALAHAHGAGIVHRDVKPSNIMLAEGHGGIHAKLLDFGLALVAEEETLTAHGDVPGTLAYISPERLRGHKGGPPADIWAIGVLLWEALAGQHPFWKGSLLDTARGIRIGAEPLGGQRPDLPAQLLALVDSALSLDPADRPSAEALAAALRAAPRHTTSNRSRKPERTRERPDRPRRKEQPKRRRGTGGGGGGGGNDDGNGSGGDRPQRPRSKAPRRVIATPRLSAPTLARPANERLAIAGLAALLAGWAAATIPFFPTGGAPLAALVAAVLGLTLPGWAFAFALAVPILPLGNIAFGAGAAWAAFAAVWLFAFRRRPAEGLLIALAPVLGAVSLLGLVPLAVLHVRSLPRRIALAVTLVLGGVLACGLVGNALPFGVAPLAGLGINNVLQPLTVLRALAQVLEHRPAIAAEAVVLAAAAAALPFLRGRSGRWLTGFGLVLAGLTVAPVRGTASLPLVASAFLVSATIAGPLVPWRRLRERAAAPRRNPQLHS